MKLAKVNALAGSPSAIIPAGQRLSTDVAIGVTKVYCTGELITAAVETSILRQFSHAILRSTYATSEAGGIGVQCATLEGARYHPLPDVLIEILDGQGHQISDNTPGLITVTKLTKRTLPIIRYQPGDEGRWDTGGCPEHPDIPVFRILGRSDQMIACGSALVALSSFGLALQHALGDVAPHTIVAEQIDGLDRIRCEVEHVAAPASLIKSFQTELYRREPELARLVNAERCWPISLATVAPGTLQRSLISGKVREFIDLRRGDRT